MRGWQKHLGAGILLAGAVSPSVEATLHFDQLSNCSSLAALREQIAGSLPNDCRAPTAPLDLALIKSTQFNPSAWYCFLQSAPSAALSSYTCVVSDSPMSRNIVCVRPSALADIEEYRRNYLSSYSDAVKSYLDAAATCDVGNGDATIAPRSVIPPAMMPYARMEVGFMLPVGRALVGDSEIFHGFSRVDPDIPDAPEAVEFVATWVAKGNATAATNVSGQEHDDVGWHVDYDPANDLMQAYREHVPPNAPIAIEAANFTVTRTFDLTAGIHDIEPIDRKRARVDDWERQLSGLLADAGFRSISDADFKRYAGGLTRKAMRARMLANQPYDRRDLIAAQSSRVVDVLIDTSSTCFGDQGATMAFVDGMYPNDGVAREYGAVSLFIMGVGTCANATSVATLKNKIHGQFISIVAGGRGM